MTSETTAEIYNKAADRWVRNEPQSLSDYTGRVPVFEMCGDVTGKRIVDLGCGEGYCARILAERGAQSVTGIDVSEKMIDAAKAIAGDDQRFNYQVGSVTELPYEDASFDLALGVFVCNYLTVEQTFVCLKEAYRVLQPGGALVFSVPHPFFPLSQVNCVPPFFFDFGGKGYFTARNKRHFGEIHRRDGQKLPVEMNHKLVADYIWGLTEAGFTQIPEIRELCVRPEHLEIDRPFFEPLWDKPLHMAFKTIKPV